MVDGSGPHSHFAIRINESLIDLFIKYKRFSSSSSKIRIGTFYVLRRVVIPFLFLPKPTVELSVDLTFPPAIFDFQV